MHKNFEYFNLIFKLILYIKSFLAGFTFDILCDKWGSFAKIVGSLSLLVYLEHSAPYSIHVSIVITVKLWLLVYSFVDAGWNCNFDRKSHLGIP